MSYPWYYILFDIVLWNLLYLTIFYCIVKNNNKGLPVNYRSHKIYSGFFLWFVVLAVFAYHTGDFDNYREIVTGVYSHNAYSHVEPVYLWLIQIVHGNYYLWRTILWGIALLFWYKSFQKLHTDNYITLLFFCGVLLPRVVEGRYFLGLSVYLYGFILLSSRKFIHTLWGTICVLSSVFLHKSLALLILLIPFSFFRLNKIRVFLIIAIFPLLLLIFNNSVGNILYAIGMETEGEGLGFEGYLFGEGYTIKSKGAILDLFLFSVSFFALMLWSLWRYRHDNNKSQAISSASRLTTLSFLIFYVAALINFSVLDSQTMARRFFMMAPYPLILIVSNGFKQKYLKNRIFKASFVFCFLWQNFYMFLQMFYFSFK